MTDQRNAQAEAERKAKKRAKAQVYYESHHEKVRANSKAYREAHPEKVRAYQKAYYESHREQKQARVKAWQEDNPEKVRANNKAYWEANREKENARRKAWRYTNPEKVRVQQKAYCEANPEKVRAAVERRRARKTNAQEATYTTFEMIKSRWDFYGGLCYLCGAKATATDHVIPLAKGGSHWPGNLRPICQPCNSSKSSKWPYSPASLSTKRRISQVNIEETKKMAQLPVSILEANDVKHTLHQLKTLPGELTAMLERVSKLRCELSDCKVAQVANTKMLYEDATNAAQMEAWAKGIITGKNAGQRDMQMTAFLAECPAVQDSKVEVSVAEANEASIKADLDSAESQLKALEYHIRAAQSLASLQGRLLDTLGLTEPAPKYETKPMLSYTAECEERQQQRDNARAERQRQRDTAPPSTEKAECPF